MKDRQGLEILSEDECWRLVAETPVGRVAFVSNGEPYVLPVNHVVLERTVAFLTGSGTKLGAAMMCEPVGFEVDGFDAEARSGWSVLVRGVAEPVYDELVMNDLETTHLEPWAQGTSRTHWVKITPNEVTGRRLP